MARIRKNLLRMHMHVCSAGMHLCCANKLLRLRGNLQYPLYGSRQWGYAYIYTRTCSLAVSDRASILYHLHCIFPPIRVYNCIIYIPVSGMYIALYQWPWCSVLLRGVVPGLGTRMWPRLDPTQPVASGEHWIDEQTPYQLGRVDGGKKQYNCSEVGSEKGKECTYLNSSSLCSFPHNQNVGRFLENAHSPIKVHSFIQTRTCTCVTDQISM